MKLLFPGSFDPFTIGHADLVERALKLGAEVVIALGINGEKSPMLSTVVRLEAIRSFYKDNPKVSVVVYEGLTVDAVRQTGADAILRGIRSVTDYDKERNLAYANRANEGVETVILVADQSMQHVSSSLVREMYRFGHSVDNLIIEDFKPYFQKE